MDTDDRKCCSNSQDEMPPQSKKKLRKKVHKILSPSDLRTLQWLTEKTPIQEKTKVQKTHHRSVLVQRSSNPDKIMHSHANPHTDTHAEDDQNRQSTSKMMQKHLQKEYQKPPKKDPHEDPLQKATHDQFKQKQPEEYRVSAYHNSIKKHSHENPPTETQIEDDQNRQSTSKMMQKNLQKVYQKHPKKDPYEDHTQKPCQDQINQKPPEEYRVSAYYNSIKKHSHENPPTETQTKDDQNRQSTSKTMQKNLQKVYQKPPKKDPYKDHTQKPCQDQLKQKPSEEYRVSLNHKSTKKNYPESPQNMQQSLPQSSDEQPPKNPDNIMQQYLQTEYQKPPKKDPYEDHTQKPCQDQINQKSPEEYRVSAYYNSIKKHSHENPPTETQTEDDQNRLSTSKMMPKNLQKVYQKPPKKDPYEDHTQKPCQDQLKQKPSEEYRVYAYHNSIKKHSIENPPTETQIEDDQNRQSTSKMMQKNLQKLYQKHHKKDPYEDHTQKPCQDQLKQKPSEEYRVYAYHNSIKKHSHENPPTETQTEDDQNRQSTSKMMQKNLQKVYQKPPKKDPYKDHAQKPCQDQLKQKPSEEYRVSAYHNSIKKHSHENPPMETQTEDDQNRQSTSKTMQKNLQKVYQKPPKKDPYEDHTQKPCRDQINQKPPEEYRVSAYYNSIKKHSHENPPTETQTKDDQNRQSTSKTMQKNLQKVYQKPPKKDPYEDHTQKPCQDQLKQKPSEEYRVSLNHKSTKKNYPERPQNMQKSLQQSANEQPPKNPDNIMQQNLQTEYQKPPKKDPYEDHPQKPCQNQINQKPSEEYRVSLNHKSTKKNYPERPQNMQKSLQQSSNEQHPKNPDNIMQQSLQTEYQKPPKKDPYENHAQKPCQNQINQKPSEEYRVSLNHNSTKKNYPERPQNIQKSLQQSSNEQPPKNPDNIMQQNLQTEYQKPPKKDPYKDHTQKPCQNQINQKPSEEYRVSLNHNSTKKNYPERPQNMQKSLQQSSNEQPPKNPDNIMQQNLQTEYQKPPKKDPYKDHTQKPCQDQLKQKPSEEYRVSLNHKSTKKSYPESPQNMQQSLQQSYDEQPPKNPDNFMQQNLQTEYQKPPKKDPYEDHPQKPCQNQINQKPSEEYRVSLNHKSTKKNYPESPQNMQQSLQQSSDEQPPKNPDNFMQQNLQTEYQKPPKKDPYKDHTQKPCQDQLKQKPSEEYRVSLNHKSTKKNYSESPQNMQQSLQQSSNEQQSQSNQSQKQRFSNAPQEQAQLNLRANKWIHSESSSKTTVVPVTGSQCNVRLVPASPELAKENAIDVLYRSGDHLQPSFMVDKTKEHFPDSAVELNKNTSDNHMECECCEKENPEMGSKYKLFRDENQMPCTETNSSRSNQISVRDGNELLSLVRNEIELQSVFMKFTDDLVLHAKKMGFLAQDHPQKPCQDQFKQQSQEECKESFFCNSSKQQSHSNQSQKQSFSNAPQELSANKSDTLSMKKKAQEKVLLGIIDQIVSSKVISPMVHKIQKQYIQNLRHEISLVDYLERVPVLVSEVCKGAVNLEESKVSK
ncbi:putative leucine-rich repeat-containing protein DDB_G0290503 [Drosophila pseudoobscura]|uniref:Leucine-rich repeat-containing protein DDB_G0290503 n=1 Tax=Drosophila pseudoobscura pseudoobscura TaxID=46245 RepID=A0A6I8W2N5_DROPS|nr:putative leucine-rich repeat-containing protein DDB_G0290503 [Drosophila pseudoobscura]